MVFFIIIGAHTAVHLNRQLISGISFITTLFMPAQIKLKLPQLRWNSLFFFFWPGANVPHIFLHAWMPSCFHSLMSTQTVGGYGRYWRTIQWPNQFGQTLEEGAGKGCLECDTFTHVHNPYIYTHHMSTPHNPSIYHTLTSGYPHTENNTAEPQCRHWKQHQHFYQQCLVEEGPLFVTFTKLTRNEICIN